MTKQLFKLLATVAVYPVLTIALAKPVAAQTYSVQDLGPLIDLPDRSDSMPYALSSEGKVAAANVTNGAYRALLYDGAWTNLGTLGGNESLGAGIDDLGRVVGYSTTTDGRTHGFLWTPGGTGGVSGNPQMLDLGAFPGGTDSQAYAINHSGQITGFAQTNTPSGTREQAFRYDEGTMTDIGRLLGGGVPNSFGYGINEAGHIVGTAYDSRYTLPRAFFYDGTTAVDLSTIGEMGSEGLAINNQDHLVGYLTTAEWFDHAFLYATGMVTELGTLGGNYSYALGINNSNVVVGGSFVEANDTVYHAFVWSTNGLVDLNTRIEPTVTGWTLLEARAINDAGQIVGVGTLDGARHTFLLTPHPSAPAGPVITRVALAGADVLISFTTLNATQYVAEASDSLTNGGWTDLMPRLSGTGGVVTATNYGAAALPKRFYRIREAGQ